tara:strand:- start:2031 stop:2189 length:159 start_codon:yes stop_codon:yes gene_type:complete
MVGDEAYVQLLGDKVQRIQVSVSELNEIKCAIEKMQARLDIPNNKGNVDIEN